MGTGGVGTLRALLNWGSVDPGPDPADYQWGGFDARSPTRPATGSRSYVPVRHPELGRP